MVRATGVDPLAAVALVCGMQLRIDHMAVLMQELLTACATRVQLPVKRQIDRSAPSEPQPTASLLLWGRANKLGDSRLLT